MNYSKCAIVVLTRGYTNINKYTSLIYRNQAIAVNLREKSIPIVIFHEGNIFLTHQDYIKKHTPLLNIQFINVKELNKAFLDHKKKIPVYEATKGFSLGYRHMCSFWFVNFWDYLEDYDYILRIDEDCFIKFDILNIFNIMMTENKVSLFGSWVDDEDFVTKNLNKFTTI
jgi:hypothetical protein